MEANAPEDCRTTYPVVKCTHCRSEFEQKSGSGTVCRRCEKNLKTYGKPSACEYCRVVAAFVGRKCQRCVHSERKYGPPQICGQCKQKCAFAKKDDPNRKAGKVLCFLCIMAHKRVLAKAQSRDKSCGVEASGGRTDSPSIKKESSSGSGSSSGGGGNHKIGSTAASKGEQQEPSSSAPSTPTSSKSMSSSSQKHKADSTEKGSDAQESAPKKPKLEKSASAANGLSLLGSESPFSDSDNMVAMTHLKEEVESLKKLVASKDQQILERDKKLTELKAKHYEADKELRIKLTAAQKKHSHDLDNLQTKNRELLKQVSSLSKSNKRSTDSPLA